MTGLSTIVAVLLLVVGIGGYLISGMASLTALIPALIGGIIWGLGRAAADPARRKMAMHVAMVVALAGIVATGRAILTMFRAYPYMPRTDSGDVNIAVVSKVLTCVILFVYLLAGVKSFIDARRK
jgi:hypothetical protein